MTPLTGLPRPRRNWALFLDIDGTIVEIAETPDSVRIPVGVLASLADAEAALGGAMALISGRSLANLDDLTQPYRFSAAGQHGAEWRIDARRPARARAGPANELEPARRALADFAVGHPGVLVEHKGATLAVHFRLAPESEVAVAALAGELAAGLTGYSVFKGKAVVEIRPDKIDKGVCIELFLQEQPFRRRLPVFAGDDRTDEDAFEAVDRCGGIAIRVGPPPPHVGRTRAHWQCADVGEFTQWLSELPRGINVDS